ncbi:hypothetical protein BN2476_500210 [Paraburkholderia piptadeniae]|uniref:Uncharacterized protein n=1 Tax=Paraburkholderia piptadeniae TaxID=1701573 RepID=A0A1N7SG77_9BURK|nr:hypothetical protein BN2476_500210 [Paraburkholderia piptadeniae]
MFARRIYRGILRYASAVGGT